jgi:two-component system phosphate regulon response regulator PhoB
VDDEADVVSLLKYNLNRAGYRVAVASNGTEAVVKAFERRPDLIVLDVMMPGLDGMEVCRMIRKREETTSIPIIMLTARSHAEDRILGFELGADDYVTKPFSPKEVVLRVTALLRRTKGDGNAGSMQEHVGFVVNRATQEITYEGQPLDLTSTEFNLLGLMVQRGGRILSRDQLLAEVWGYNANIDTRTVDTHVRRLRDKLGACAGCVETVRGYGYRLRARTDK